MQIVCPYCKKTSEFAKECSYCHTNIKWVYDIYCKSEVYYTKGYVCTTKGNLSQAKKYLRKAIYLNKYQIEARNLLGVIEFECGNIGEALKQWQISCAIQGDDNKATEYIATLKKNVKEVKKYKEANDLYNSALKYISQNSEDIAVIRLKKAIQLNPNFIEARNLLTLCLIERRHYQKAMEHISYVLKIDQCNSKALSYLKIVKLDEIKRDLSQEQVNYTIANKKYCKPQKVLNRGQFLFTAILYFGIGMVCMLGVQVGLILPNKTAGLESQIYELEGEKKSLEKDLEVLTQETNDQILNLQSTVEKQKKYADELQKNTNKLRQQQKLATAKEYANAREWTRAADELYNIAKEELEQTSQEEYENLKINVYQKATDELYNKGYSFYRVGNNVEALPLFEKSVLYGVGTGSVST
ncbi:MAG: hypothetical protein ACRC1P_00470, partial [Cellulosilyticaceae bacterium]